MVAAYALEARDRLWIAVFAAGCASAAVYAVLTRSWIFAGLEFAWAALAIRRFVNHEETP